SKDGRTLRVPGHGSRRPPLLRFGGLLTMRFVFCTSLRKPLSALRVGKARPTRLNSRHVRPILLRAEAGRRAGDAARIFDADGGDGEGPRGPARGGLLLSLARRAGEGRA